jgi:hypothetical protein
MSWERLGKVGAPPVRRATPIADLDFDQKVVDALNLNPLADLDFDHIMVVNDLNLNPLADLDFDHNGRR